MDGLDGSVSPNLKKERSIYNSRHRSLKNWCMLLKNLQTRNLMKPAVMNLFSFLFTSFTFVFGGTCAFCQPLPWWITLERSGSWLYQGLINCVKVVGQSDFGNGIISGVQPVWVTKIRKI